MHKERASYTIQHKTPQKHNEMKELKQTHQPEMNIAHLLKKKNI